MGISAVTRKEAWYSRKRAIETDFKSRGRYYSPNADKYLKDLQSYGVYCREEKINDWFMVSSGLVNNISPTNERDWLWESYLFESTCEMMKSIHSDVDWDEISFKTSRFASSFVESMTELLLEFSPNGIEFVDRVVKPYVDGYEDMSRVQKMYKELTATSKTGESGKGQFIKTDSNI